ncbi:MAG: repeat protein [Phenylobacterium sp.]|nr:repeat protein [Phenylobacterium sp.]
MTFGFGKRRDGKIGSVSTKDVVGALFNAPNTAVGVAYGSVGDAVGEAAYAMGLAKKRPQMAFRDGAVEFTDNPFGGVSAITIGDSTTYKGNPYDPRDGYWARDRRANGYPVWEHEKQHRIQGRQLGPLYLPSNLAGGLNALVRDGEWHGPSNWNERGPQLNPPRPWAPKSNR